MVGYDAKKSIHEAWIPKEDNLSTGMATTMFRPCIDLHEGKVKQIVGGTLNDSGAVENFVSEKSPSWYADALCEGFSYEEAISLS